MSVRSIDDVVFDESARQTEESQIRLRPSMWLEDNPRRTGTREITDNSADVFVRSGLENGKIHFEYNSKTKRFIVQDNAGGLPVKDGVPEIQSAYTPFVSANYSNSGDVNSFTSGTNGVGASATRCVSKFFNVISQRRNRAYTFGWRNGLEPGVYDKGAKFSSKPNPSKTDNLEEDGTRVEWEFDNTVLSAYPDFDPQEFVESILYTYAMLLGDSHGVTTSATIDGKKTEFNVSGGILGHVQRQATEWDLEPREISGTLTYRRTRITADKGAQEYNDKVNYTLAFGVKKGSFEKVISDSYINIVHTQLGGFHSQAVESALESAVTTVLNRRGNNTLRKGENPPVWRDISQGLIFAIRVEYNNPPFAGQGKSTIKDNELRSLLTNALTEDIGSLFNKERAYGDGFARRAVENSRVREINALKREQKRKKSSGTNASFSMPDKLSDCKEHGVDSELFITEGDSAKGSILAARDSTFQAVYPVRGNTRNIYGMATATALKNAEMNDLATMLGAGVGKAFDPDACRYERILIATDADPDGAHIQALLILAFHDLFPGIIEEGRLFLCVPPLFTVREKKGDKLYQCVNEDELKAVEERLKKDKITYSIVRNKGLGEMDTESTAQTLTDVKTRRLRQVGVNDEEEAKALAMELGLWFGNDPSRRREVLSSEGHLYFDSVLESS